MENKVDSHKRKNNTEAENSIEISTKKKKNGKPAAKLISGYDFAEARVVINCYPIRFEKNSPSPSCVFQKARR